MERGPGVLLNWQAKAEAKAEGERKVETAGGRGPERKGAPGGHGAAGASASEGAYVTGVRLCGKASVCSANQPWVLAENPPVCYATGQ